MDPVLFLAHRVPYPPNKGDKIRSYHLLRFLRTRYRVFLGTFADTEDDMAHAGVLAEWCEAVRIVRIRPPLARLRSLSGLATGEALTVPYYRSETLRRWVNDVVRAHDIRRALVFSSSMGQYVAGLPDLRVVADLVDVDSAKWSQYAQRRRWPASWIFQREGQRLLAFERGLAARAAATTLVTRAEVDLFLSLAPESAGRVSAVENGVDVGFFAPDAARPNPYSPTERAIVFTGAMDYWPNIDAVVWFAREVLPALRGKERAIRFYVVGMDPAPPVKALAGEPGIVVTGRVPDVRPYLQHAAAVVAPLRVARGVQNKVLEAMAMGRPVVVSSAAARGISAVAGRDFEAAGEPDEYVRKLLGVLDPATGSAMGARARSCVVANYDWDRNFSAIARLLDAQAAGVADRLAGALA